MLRYFSLLPSLLILFCIKISFGSFYFFGTNSLVWFCSWCIVWMYHLDHLNRFLIFASVNVGYIYRCKLLPSRSSLILPCALLCSVNSVYKGSQLDAFDWSLSGLCSARFDCWFESYSNIIWWCASIKLFTGCFRHARSWRSDGLNWKQTSYHLLLGCVGGFLVRENYGNRPAWSTWSKRISQEHYCCCLRCHTTPTTNDDSLRNLMQFYRQIFLFDVISLSYICLRNTAPFSKS